MNDAGNALSLQHPTVHISTPRLCLSATTLTMMHSSTLVLPVIVVICLFESFLLYFIWCVQSAAAPLLACRYRLSMRTVHCMTVCCCTGRSLAQKVQPMRPEGSIQPMSWRNTTVNAYAQGVCMRLCLHLTLSAVPQVEKASALNSSITKVCGQV